jgi:leader peptidase (prepilin peptidase)/N-methyltransferase
MIGLIVGSFINVVVYRLPQGLSVVRPRSSCPVCATPIAATDNIPVLSWLLLRGRCRSCSAPISARYPVTELLSGLLFLLVLLKASVFLPGDPANFWLASLHGVLLTSLLLAVTLIDLDHFIIPDILSLPGCLVGLALAAVAPAATGVTWQYAGIGALAGSGFLLLVAVSYSVVRGREGMGMGDVKLMTTIGAFLGFSSIPFVIFAAALQGSVLAIFWILLFRAPETEKDALPGAAPDSDNGEVAVENEQAAPEGLGGLQVPFGPFLALGAVEWYLFSEVLADFFP